MSVNFDEQLLLGQRVMAELDEPIQNQILRIALYDEYHAFEFYSQIVDKFGLIPPFINIVEAEKAHYSVLLQLLERYQVEAPVNDWAERLVIPDSLVECCEVGVAVEIDNIAMYDHLLLYTQQNDIQDSLFRLQAASYNHHLPALRKAVASYSNYSADKNNINSEPDNKSAPDAEEMLNKFEEYKTLLQSVISGNIDQAELGKLLSSSNMSLITGLLTGSFGALLLNNISKDSENDSQASGNPL